MSGPKSSSYTMTLIQLHRLQEELKRAREAQILEERKKIELEVIHKNCKQLKDAAQRLGEITAQIEHISNGGSDNSTDTTNLRRLYKEALAEIRKTEIIGTNKSLEQIKRESQAILLLMKEVYLESKKAAKRLEEQENSFIGNAVKNIADGFELSFDNISDRKALKENTYLIHIIDELDKLAGLTISEEQRGEYEKLKKKSNEITSIDFLKNFYSISVIPFVKSCIEYDKLYKQYGEDYRILCLRYQHLSKALNHKAESIPFSDQAVSLLLEKIAHLEAEELKIKEEEYISRCIEEAMSEMNYSVIGNRNVKKKSGKQFKSVLYKFDEGTAVNVTYSNEGQITMELGGIGNDDREPSDLESASLEEDMKNFCNDFYEIEEKLKKKGIESKHISHLPPEAQFAQIINISDYDIVEDIGLYEVKDKKMKNIRPANAVLHREG